MTRVGLDSWETTFQNGRGGRVKRTKGGVEGDSEDEKEREKIKHEKERKEKEKRQNCKWSGNLFKTTGCSVIEAKWRLCSNAGVVNSVTWFWELITG